MNNKEQIMIDGVDVGGCKYYLRNVHKSCGQGLVDCEGKDCMFKQLIRKTQKYEALTNTNRIHAEIIEELNNKYNDLKEDYKELEQRHNGAFQDFERLKQECEELKEKLKTAENDAIVRFVERNIQCVSPTNCRFVNLRKQECEQKQKIIEELKKEAKRISANYIKDEARYRKALEEIEEECNYAPMCDTEFSQRVLDIINKAKG